MLEERTVLLNQTIETNPIFLLYSSYPKLQQRVAWIRRFLYNIKPANNDKRLYPYLTLQELQEATKCLVRMAQKEVFGAEFLSLQKSGQVDSNSRLKSLTPYLDDDLLHVGGRLRHADVSPSRKHPLILPAGHPLSMLIANHYHFCYQHAGATLLISLLREKFWPLRARNLARRVVHSCVSCFRNRPTPLEQLMGDLPRERVTPTLPFLRTGVDLCGPIFYKYPNRKAPPVKGYVAIFVCLVVKAVHIEMVADLSTNAFLAALRRFVSRRGRPQLIECDNAKNFIGASREVAQLAKQFQTQQFQQTVIKSCANESIEFKFIPPRSPNFGGLWEAAVKSFKTHLKPTIGNAILTYEEFTTLLTQIEACLNSRPLTPMSSDPNDYEALTPAHFLIHRSIVGLAEPSYESRPINRLDRYEQVQEFLRRLWNRWSSDYLSGLHPKTKWTKQRDNITLGTMVLVKEDNLPPRKWCLGRVTDIVKGADGNVRVVFVRTKDGEFKRTISKLCVLPIRQTTSEEC
ncbi:uncharacterized protein LOC120899524 [Anopheles arabiensis]|uniref:uncharacterized protein LOC120899524 n=1 Tax=Anopheles arabiensis TaxID=7173 RepID=UPI001AADE8D8|nr:uncharacterized protein LOC120899524 [Anopheles arabiensis]